MKNIKHTFQHFSCDPWLLPHGLDLEVGVLGKNSKFPEHSHVPVTAILNPRNCTQESFAADDSHELSYLFFFLKIRK